MEVWRFGDIGIFISPAIFLIQGDVILILAMRCSHVDRGLAIFPPLFPCCENSNAIAFVGVFIQCDDIFLPIFLDFLNEIGHNAKNKIFARGAWRYFAGRVYICFFLSKWPILTAGG